MSVDQDAATELIESRVREYGLLCFESLTPLLKHLLQQSSAFHSQVLKLPVIHSRLLQELDNFHDIVQEHWRKVHNSLSQHAQLIAHMCLFMEILSSQLIREYTRAPAQRGPEDAAVVEMYITLVQQHPGSEGDSDNEQSDHSYQDVIVAPIEELMFKQEYVEHRLMVASESCKRPKDNLPGTAHYFIKLCDWPRLANILVRDRELAFAIVEAGKQSSTMRGYFPKDDAIKVVRGIGDLRDKYFTDLSSPTDFTLSKYAKKQSPPFDADHTSATKSITVGKYLKPEKGAWASARGIADSIKGHLGDVRSRVHQSDAQPAPGEEERGLLVTDSKKHG